MNLLKKLKELIFSKNENPLTEQTTAVDIAEEYAFFDEYGVTEGQVYLIRLGLFSDEINEYLSKHRASIKDYFLTEPGDYIKVLGRVSQNEKKFLLFVVFTESYDRKVGNFMPVEKWPPFQNYEEKTEDSHWQVYNEFKNKV